jgi:DNA-binding transcriptional ArsR family regulator
MMSMLAKVNTSFQTTQSDLFESGLVAAIGVNAFAIWSAIKAHSDYQTGISWPSVRRLMALTGLASATVQKSLNVLEEAKLLRSEVKGRRRYYVARERLDVSLGSAVVCSVVVDYVPAKMRGQISALKEAAAAGEFGGEAWAQVEIIPGAGFEWDSERRVLRGAVRASELGLEGEMGLGELGQVVERQRQRAVRGSLRALGRSGVGEDDSSVVLGSGRASGGDSARRRTLKK